MGGGFTHFLMPLVFDGIKSAGSPAFQVGTLCSHVLDMPKELAKCSYMCLPSLCVSRVAAAAAQRGSRDHYAGKFLITDSKQWLATTTD
jgi:hypothetical protein